LAFLKKVEKLPAKVAKSAKIKAKLVNRFSFSRFWRLSAKESYNSDNRQPELNIVFIINQ